MNQANEQYVVFSIYRSLYGISLHEVLEIIRMQTVTWIPNSQQQFLGIIHLRDKVIPVLSLHRIFSETEKKIDSKTRIIVVHNKGRELGIVVDEVDRVMTLPEQCISPPPSNLLQNGWMKGVYLQQEIIIALLNLESLLGNLDVNQVVTG